MNSIADRFSTTSPLAELRKAQANVEDDEFSDAAWGSEAGFGSLAKGVPAFTVPNVPDVCIYILHHNNVSSMVAFCLPEVAHG
jgi:20S proteasome subunit beta 5